MLERSGMQAGPRAHGSRPLMQARRTTGVMQRHGVLHPVQLLQRPVACEAASGSDPYEFLGVPAEANSNEVARAVSKLRWAHRADREMLKKIEAAQSQMFMDSLNARIKDGKGVPREILYADREPLFPWRPKRWDATPKIIMIAGGIQLAMAAFAFQSPNMSKLIGCMLLGIAGNVMKQNAIHPPPKEPEYATEEEAARPGQNFQRGALLGLIATGGGVVLATAPETLMQALNLQLPGILASQPGILISLKVATAALANWIMTAFYY
ncbi:hypothetical protein FOA52_008662 [Chlamydomonas sp. UWO 241]|nr:hypothetical protein FOA52_008662 [Chlamydomonas sp. UWO 241]